MRPLSRPSGESLLIDCADRSFDITLASLLHWPVGNHPQPITVKTLWVHKSYRMSQWQGSGDDLALSIVSESFQTSTGSALNSWSTCAKSSLRSCAFPEAAWPTAMTGATVLVRPTNARAGKPAEFWGLKGSGSIHGKTLVLTVVNPSVGEPRETEISIPGAQAKSAASRLCPTLTSMPTTHSSTAMSWYRRIAR